MPVTGGAPARLTWHPGADTVQGFTPDGRSVLFTSQRATFTTRYAQLFTVPVQGGIEEALPIPNASRATYSPDGQRIAYNPLAARFLQWKQYRGGTASRLWLYSVKGHAVEKIPQPAARANDTDPMWMGDTVYFRSDRAGEFNLFAFDTKSKQVQQLTRHADFPVLTASSGGNRIVYEQAGSLHLFDPRGGAAKKLTIGVASDLRETRPRFAKGAKWIRDAALSPTGARAAFNFRGEIVTVPAEKGDVRNLTNSTAVHDRFPAWSPDGRSLAWFSDANDGYQLYIGSQDGKGEPRAINVKGEGFYSDPVWSPDSQKIAYYDNSQSVYWVDVKSGVSKKIASQPLYGPVVVLSYSWSPDSKWLAYAMDNRAYITTVYAYSIEQDKSFQISDGLSDVSNPAFDKSGKYLFFLASTDAGPVKDWFAQSNADMRVTSGIYLAVLPNDLVSPLARESDEEKPAAAEKKDEAKPDVRKEDARGPVPEDKPAAREQPFRIDFDGLPYRILDLPIAPAEISNLQAGTAGQVYYLKTVDGKSALNRYDLTARKNETLLPDVSGYVVSADGEEAAVRERQQLVDRLDDEEDRAGGRPAERRRDRSARRSARRMEADLRRGVADQSRLLLRPEHARRRLGAAAREVRGVPAARGDARRPESRAAVDVERAVGRTPQRRRRRRARRAEDVPGGLLGADYEIANGRYRLKKVYGGLNWNPQLRAPLTEPGVNAKPASTCSPSTAGTCVRRPTSTACSRTPPARSSRSRSVRMPTARDRGPCRSCRSPTKPRCATATGSKAT